MQSLVAADLPRLSVCLGDARSSADIAMVLRNMAAWGMACGKRRQSVVAAWYRHD
jgi:hypothetical protein